MKKYRISNIPFCFLKYVVYAEVLSGNTSNRSTIKDILKKIIKISKNKKCLITAIE